MIERFIRNLLNGQHIIHKIRQVQTVQLTFLHQCIKNECPPAAVLSLGARMASSSSSSNHPSHRSKLLDDYHNNRAVNLQLTDLSKHVVEFAQDTRGSGASDSPQQTRPVLEQLHDNVLTLVTNQYGCHVIQRVLEHGLPEDRERIVRSLHENLFTLVTDKHGNYLIRRVLEHGLPEDRERIVRSLHENVTSLSLHEYGSRVIEHVIEHGLPEDRERIVRSLQGDIMKYAQDKFGSLVIEKCVICGTPEQKKALFNNVCVGGPQTLQNVRQLMADEFGTLVIQVLQIFMNAHTLVPHSTHCMLSNGIKNV
uniref:PUM-HD domain-containing protein n=1 Tax=Globodera pallida TaxID=36090 RepID=A0A183C736_GLOPA